MLIELLEEYKETDNEKQKKLLIKEFTTMLWKSKYTYKKYKREYTYKIDEDKLNNNQELIELFNRYKIIEFTFCKSFYKKRMDYIDYIRIHVNNMYGFISDNNVYLPKQYYQLLLTPKKEYYRAIDLIKNGERVSIEEIENNIKNALIETENIKIEHGKNKINIKWRDYKKLIEGFIERIFNNYIPPEEYEKKHGWKMKISVDGWSENNYIIRYFCRSLTGYIRNYIRDSKPKEIKKKQCNMCKNEFVYKSNNKLYCDSCSKIKQLEWQRNSMKKLRNM